MANIQTTKTADMVTIKVVGNFTFDINRQFRDAYKEYPDQKSFVVDLSEAIYMDSSGLGMLMQLREHAGGDHADINLSGATGVIANILEVASFSKLFTIS